MPLNNYTRKITWRRYREQRKASAMAKAAADVVNGAVLGVKTPASSGASARLRLTPREILQIKNLLKRERQAEISVPSIAHLAGKYDSDTMNEIRQAIRENRENEASAMKDE